MIKNISNLGDASVYCDFGNEVNEKINSNVINYFKHLKRNKINGITNITPSYNKLIISFDLEVINFEKLKDKIKKINLENIEKEEKKIVKVPICIDDEFSLDLKRLSNKLKITEKQIISSFLSKEYFCYMTGFIAGMPFMGDIDSKIRLYRLETPRVKVPKGSIGITEQFCNIYTFESPGGWNIIGNTPMKIFDKLNKNNPVKINPGDNVVFYQINKNEFLKSNE
jgi:KipI family sensor histidine kinase inhibitor|tara:strand:+ start:69 stop:743 length:675 start_codon:yes stop_codon:yes gene_type:complete